MVLDYGTTDTSKKIHKKPHGKTPQERTAVYKSYKDTVRLFGSKKKDLPLEKQKEFRQVYWSLANERIQELRMKNSSLGITEESVNEESTGLSPLSSEGTESAGPSYQNTSEIDIAPSPVATTLQTPPKDIDETATIDFQETRPIERPLTDASALNIPQGIEETATKIVWQNPTTRSTGEDVLLDMRIGDVWPFTIYRGYAGVGKTMSLINWGIKNGYKVFIHGASSDQETYDYVGSYIVKGNEMIFQASAITSAVEESKRSKVLLIIDEIDQMTPEVTKALASLFDDNRTVRIPGKEIVGSNANLKIIGTMNKEADSAGNPLDPAFRSRGIIVDVDGEKIVSALIKEGEITPGLGKVMRDTNYRFAIREVRQLKALMTVMSAEDALAVLVQKYDEGDDRNQVIQAFRHVYGVKITKL